MSALRLVEELKKNGQDHEFYPTTNEIIDALYADYKILGTRNFKGKYEYQGISLLDIGAGTCKLFNRIKEVSESKLTHDEHGNKENGDQIGINKYMVIEKSQILINKMPSDTFVVGTDFNENTLIDKKADVVFCNPPYSEYGKWAERIITEANAKHIYLVIPQRWGNHQGIKMALKKRNAKAKIVGNYDFLNSEDRKARAYVSLVRITLGQTRFRGKLNDSHEVDPFNAWFNDTFPIDGIDTDKDDDYFAKRKANEKETAKLKDKLVNADDLVGALVELYNEEMEKLFSTYRKVTSLDAEILKELNVDLTSLRNGLKEKISGTKYRYWQEIFDNLDKITARLTKKSRDSLLGSLMSSTHVDFNASNVRNVVIWVIKNANKYYDQQMIEVYDDFTGSQGVKLYKSNQHWTHDSWRYAQALHEKGIKYALDYRIVREGWLSDYDIKYSNGISDSQQQAILDLIVVATNLGFSYGDNINIHEIQRGEKYSLYLNPPKGRVLKIGAKTNCGKIEEVYAHTNIPNENGERVQTVKGVIYVYDKINKETSFQYKIDGMYHDASHVKTADDIFTTVKGFKNANVHFQMAQNFIKKFNLEVGRLRGWLKDPMHAAEEMDISIEEAAEYWESNFVLMPSNVSHLLPESIMNKKETTTDDVNTSIKLPEENEEDSLDENSLDLTDSIVIEAIETETELGLYEDEKIVAASGDVYVQSSLFN